MQTKFTSASLHNDSGLFFASNSFSTSGGSISFGSTSRNDEDLLQTLPYARGAEFNTYERQRDAGCLPNTRVAVLADIMAWASGRDDCGVYWLNGMAGTGKSTIARTIARRCAAQQRLGASFFFTRGGGDLASARKFATTVARQLAAASAPLKRHIGRALRAGGGDVAGVALQDQWRRLVLEPLTRGNGWASAVASAVQKPRPLVLVIDALDECGSDDDVDLVLQLLLSSEAKLARRRLRILVTSRPETQIRHCFDIISEADCRRLILHRIEPPVVDSDIAIFFDVRLTDICRTFVCDPHWPGADNVHRLVERAGGLFIWAATAIRFIDDGRQFANDRLEEVLIGVDSDQAPEQGLSHIYLTVLRAAARGKYRESEVRELTESLKDVLGTIAVLSAPLSGASLARLLNLSGAGISRTLHSLHSILDVPNNLDQPIRLHHSSFREFLLDHDRCVDTRFWVDGAQRHRALAETCLRVMCEGLRSDMCGLKAPGTLVSEVNRVLVNERLPPVLQYACCYWADHYRNANHLITESKPIETFLNYHFLHWLEALSLLGRLSDSIAIITTLESLSLNGNADVQAFVHDSRRFILANMAIIERAPLQMYSAALLFSPETSIVRQQFAQSIPAWVRRRPKMQPHWSANVLTLSCGSVVESIALSPNDQLLASATAPTRALPHATIFLWRTNNGELCGTLTGCTAVVTALVFSPDSRLLVSGSEEGAVRLWNPTIRTLRGTLLTPASVVDIVFSPDGQLLAASSLDMVVRIWSVKNRALLHALSGAESGVIKYLAFAPDGKSLVFGSSGRPVSLWDVTTGALLSSFEHDARSVSSLAMSPDGQLLACAKKDRSIDVRKVGEGSLLHTFAGHLAAAMELAFSLNSHLLYSRGGSTTKVWDLKTGALRCTMGCPDMAALQPVLSPDGLLMATIETGGNVYIWDAQDGHQVGLLSGHSNAVSNVVFSHNGQLLASASSDGTVRIWEVRRNARGNSRPQFKGVKMHFTLDGTILAVSKMGLHHKERLTDIWNVATQALQRTIDGSYACTPLSSGATLIATAASEGRVTLSNESTVALFDASMHAPSCMAHFVALSPNGQHLAVLFNGSHAFLFDTTTRTLRHEFRAHGVAFSPDSRTLAVCYGGAVKIRDVKTAAVTRILEGHSEDPVAVSFSSAGQSLASTDGYSIRLWNCKTWRTVRILSFRDEVSSLAFSADSSQLITNRGQLAITHEAAQRSSSPQKDKAHSALAQMYIIDEWVTWAGRRMLWLPPHFRHVRKSLAVHDRTLAFCCPDGTIGFADFDFTYAAAVAAADAVYTSSQGAVSSGYRWRTPSRFFAIEKKYYLLLGIQVLCLAFCWGRSSSWPYLAFWTLLIVIFLLDNISWLLYGPALLRCLEAYEPDWPVIKTLRERKRREDDALKH